MDKFWGQKLPKHNKSKFHPAHLRLHKVLSGEVAAMYLQGVLVCIVAATGEAHPAETSELGPAPLGDNTSCAIYVLVSRKLNIKKHHFIYVYIYIHNQLAKIGFIVTPFVTVTRHFIGHHGTPPVHLRCRPYRTWPHSHRDRDPVDSGTWGNASWGIPPPSTWREGLFLRVGLVVFLKAWKNGPMEALKRLVVENTPFISLWNCWAIKGYQ